VVLLVLSGPCLGVLRLALHTSSETWCQNNTRELWGRCVNSFYELIFCFLGKSSVMSCGGEVR
jgi:hypothetical protein